MGLTLEEATGAGAKIFPHFHPDDHAEINEAAWRASLASGEPLSIEVRVRRADGQYRWHTSRRVPLRDEKGDIIRWYSVGIDIEDQKVAEDALGAARRGSPKAERELQLTIDTIPAFVTVFGPDGEREYVNKSWRDNTGLQRGGHSGRRLDTHRPPGRPGEVRTAVARRSRKPASRSRSSSACAGTTASTGGTWAARVPLRDDSGNILRWYSVAIDIEDQKRADEALRESEAQLKEAQRELQLTIDSIPVLVAAYRPDGIRTFVNQTWRDYTGLTQQEVTGEAKTAFPHFHPDDAEPIERAIRASLASGEPLPMKCACAAADGEYRWHSVRRVPLRDENGAIIRWYSTGFDIQDQKVAEEARRQSEARLAEAERELRLTLDSIPTMTWRAAPQWLCAVVNKRWFDYTGSTPEQVQNNGWQSFVHPDDLAGSYSPAGGEIFLTGSRSTPRRACAVIDGAYRWFLFRVEPARDESGDDCRMVRNDHGYRGSKARREAHARE